MRRAIYEKDSIRLTTQYYIHVSREFNGRGYKRLPRCFSKDPTGSSLRRAYVACRWFLIPRRIRLEARNVANFQATMDAYNRSRSNSKRTSNSND